MRGAGIALLIGIVSASTGMAADAEGAYVVGAATGEKIRCGPNLSVTVKLRRPDSIPRFLAGVGEVSGTSELRQHVDAEEIVHVNRGWGHVLVRGRKIQLGPGSIVHIPAGVPRRFVSTGEGGMEYFFALSNAASAPCGASRRQSARSPVTAFDPGEGERISYCLFPLTVTTKIDQESAPEATLTAAVGELRRGEESATHRGLDEIVYVTRGTGLAIAGDEKVRVESGSLAVNPGGSFHGLINEGADTLNYFIVFSDRAPRTAFRKLATRPGSYCPSR